MTIIKGSLKSLKIGEMNYMENKGMAGKYSFFMISMVAAFMFGGCSLPALFKGDAENPHLKRKCRACHSVPDELLASVGKGEGEGDYSGEARALKSDLNGICTGCHEPGKGDHAVGNVPGINKRHLPLDREGRITCAITCHDVHTKNSDDPVVMKGLLRLHPTDLCLSCHDK